MSVYKRKKLQGRDRRRVRVRKKVAGTAARPRLSIFRSAKHIYAQLIDDDAGVTLGSASTRAKGSRDEMSGKKSERAKKVGAKIAAVCAEKQLTTVVFDRGGYRYHGRVKAVAEGAREGGLKF